MPKNKPLKMDCERCEAVGKEHLGEGLQTGICRACEGKSEIEFTEPQLETIKEYLKRRARGFTHNDAIVTMDQDQAKGAKDFFAAKEKAFKEISELIGRVSIAHMEEIRQFVEGRLKEIQ